MPRPLQTFLATIIGIVLLTGALLTPTGAAEALTNPEKITVYKNQIFTKTNNYRTGQKLNKLSGSIHLNKIAQDWANHMANNNDYRHNPNVGTQTRSTPGWTWAGGENIAYGQADGNSVSTAWWNSPGHKANILFPGYNRIGIGVAFNKNGTPYYVQVYGHNTGADKTMGYPELKADPKSPFYDVRSNDKFFKEIEWMHKTGISTGTKTAKGYKYDPKAPVTREAMAAFLYRSAGATTPAPKKSPFIDLKPGDKFYKEISWMHSQGISTGTKTSKGYKYDPKAPVTREAMAAFLYRSAGATEPGPSTAPFRDVLNGHKFYKEVSWMHSQGISTGIHMFDNFYRYDPKSPVTREAMAAFLYRSR